METARKRHEARAGIKSIDKERNGRFTPTNANPMAVTVQSMLATFGVEPGRRHSRASAIGEPFTKTNVRPPPITSAKAARAEQTEPKWSRALIRRTTSAKSRQ
jgi:hypothetical protein